MSRKIKLKHFNIYFVLWTFFNAALFGFVFFPLANFSLLWSFLIGILFAGSCILVIIKIRQLEAEADLKQKYFDHESKRHFQVLQSLIYIESYDEAKSYLQQVTESQF